MREIPPIAPPLLARFGLASAAVVALALFARFAVDPALAAESGWLTRLSAPLALALALLAPSRSRTAEIGTLAAVAAAWAIPVGPSRGAAVVAIWIAALAFAAWQRFGAPQRDPGIGAFLALALAAAALEQAPLYLPGEARHAADLAWIATAALAALALWLLAASDGRGTALLAGGVAFLATGKLGVAAAGALLLAAAWRRAGERATRGFTAALALAGLAALAFAWRTGLDGAPVDSPFSTAWTALLLLPALIFGPRPGQARSFFAALALLIAAVALRLPAPALAPGLALAALALRDEVRFRLPQAIATGTFTALTLAAASYPWLRADPTAAALAVAGWAPTAAAAGSCLAAVALLAGLAGLTRCTPRRLAAASAVALWLALAWAQRGASRLLLESEPRRLTHADAVWQTELAGSPTTLVLDLALTDAVDLPAGIAVAEVEIEGSDGRRVLHALRAGVEVSEWAAARPDVAQQLAAPVPTPWVSWVPPSGEFFASRWRARIDLDAALAPSRLTVRRASLLPDAVAIALFRVEARE